MRFSASCAALYTGLPFMRFTQGLSRMSSGTMPR